MHLRLLNFILILSFVSHPQLGLKIALAEVKVTDANKVQQIDDHLVHGKLGSYPKLSPDEIVKKHIELRDRYRSNQKYNSARVPRSLITTGYVLGGICLLGIPFFLLAAPNNPYMVIPATLSGLGTVTLAGSAAFYDYKSRQHDRVRAEVLDEAEAYQIDLYKDPYPNFGSRLSNPFDHPRNSLGLAGIMLLSLPFISDRPLSSSKRTLSLIAGTGAVGVSLYLHIKKKQSSDQGSDKTSNQQTTWLTPSRIDDDWALSFGSTF